MSQVTSTAAPPAGASAGKFLAELATAWTILRLYSSDHPAFQKCVAGAADHLKHTISVQVHPKGFLEGGQAIADSETPLAERLTSLGIVELTVETGLTAEHLAALVLLLEQAYIGGPRGQELAQAMSDKTGQRVRADALRTADLQLVEAAPAETDDAAARWRELFASSSEGAARQFAESFEQTMQGVSEDRQRELIDSWRKTLASLGPSQADSNQAAATMPGQIDVVSSFLQSLNADLSQRLIRETISDAAVPEQVSEALAQRLPAGMVLSALSQIQRTNGAPSSAAMAMFRKVAANSPMSVPGNRPPVSNEELAQAAVDLERILSTSGESKFVPDEYLARRKQLSEMRIAAAKVAGEFYCPDERETARHAAQIVLTMLASDDSPIDQVLGAVDFLKRRLSGWIRSGEFLLAGEVITLARRLSAHKEPSVAAAARQLHDGALDADDLLAGASQCYDRRKGAEAVAELMRLCEGAAVLKLLTSDRLEGATYADNVIVAAVQRLFVLDRGGACVGALLAAMPQDAPKPLLSALTGLDGGELSAVTEAVLERATPALRKSVLQALLRRAAPWPVQLIERLLLHDDPSARRIAAMRLVRDTGPATAASYFHTAATTDTYAPDVAMDLAELLKNFKSEPAVREAFSAWRWSGRRWGGMLGLGQRRAG